MHWAAKGRHGATRAWRQGHTCASSCDSLPPLLVLNIPTGKDSFAARLRGARARDNVAVRICLQLPGQKL